MKKILLLSSLTIFVATFIYTYFNDYQEQVTSNSEEWKAFEKTKNSKIESRKITENEKKQIRSIPSKNGNNKLKRTIASKANNVARTLISENSERPKSFVNKISNNWEELLGHNLLMHRKDESKVFVKQVGSFITVEQGNGRYVEKVLVTTITELGKQFSFNALVDSESGQVIDTWNRTIHEEFGKKNQNVFSNVGAIY